MYVWHLCPLQLANISHFSARLAKKKDEQFCIGGDSAFSISGVLKVYLAVLKVATNADTTVENDYTFKSAWKCETVRKTGIFAETASEIKSTKGADASVDFS